MAARITTAAAMATVRVTAVATTVTTYAGR